MWFHKRAIGPLLAVARVSTRAGFLCQRHLVAGNRGYVFFPPTNIDVGHRSLPDLQVSVSVHGWGPGRCTNLFRFQGQESGKSSAPLPLPGLIVIRDSVLRSASPALFVARGAQTWELRIVSTTISRRGVLGGSSGWARRARIVGERRSMWKCCEQQLIPGFYLSATSIRMKKKVSG